MTTIENATAGRATIGYYMILEYPKTLQRQNIRFINITVYALRLKANGNCR